MNTLTTLTQEQAEPLMNNYSTAMNSASNVSKWFSTSQSNEGPRIRGYKVGFPDFLILISAVGYTRLEVCFGLDTGEDAGAPFKLLFRMTNDDGTLLSRYHLLTDPITDTQHLPFSNTGTSYSTYNQVPRINYEIWSKNWENMNLHVPSNALKIITHVPDTNDYTTHAITKYTFQLRDILNTFYPVSIGQGGTPSQNPELYVIFACHSSDFYPSNDTAIWGEFDQIGIMFAMTEETYSGERQLVSSCYDFSAPCPPTCPIG